jgi:predicted GTPase
MTTTELDASSPSPAAALARFHERKATVQSALEELAAVATGIGARSLAERTRRDLVQKLDEDRFHLVVVGEFNHGKTSFVNALVGGPFLPVGVTPTTAAIHHIRYGSEPSAKVVYEGGAEEALDFAAVRSFAVGGSGLSDRVDHLDIRVPAALLEERILLVDTPGVNDLSLQRADITYSYIPRADAVLFLLDAGQILKESERAFLQDKLLAASRDKIVFVITKWDLLSDGERKEAFAYAKDQLARLVKDPVVFPVSAESALEGRVAESGMPELVRHLTRFLAEERGRILLDNALGEGLGVTALLDRGLDARLRAVTMQNDELDRRIDTLTRDLTGQATTIEQRRSTIREEVASIKTGARKDLERFVDDVVAKLPAVIDDAKSEDLKDFLPAFLEDTFRKWADVEAKSIGATLETLAEKTIALVRQDARDASGRVATALGVTTAVPLDIRIDTFRYEVGIVTLVTAGIGTLFANALLGVVLLVAAPVLALVVRERVQGEYRKRVKEMAPELLRTAAARVGPKLDEMIDDFAKNLDTWVGTASEELHREILEVLEAARGARLAAASDETAARTAVEAEAKSLGELRESLVRHRRDLWMPASGATADGVAGAATPPEPS